MSRRILLLYNSVDQPSALYAAEGLILHDGKVWVRHFAPVDGPLYASIQDLMEHLQANSTIQNFHIYPIDR